MKRLLVGLVTGWVFLCFSGNAFAEIMTYTFQGNVTSITRDANIVAGLIAIGDYAEFTFDLDLDAAGTQVRYNGQFIQGLIMISRLKKLIISGLTMSAEQTSAR